MDVLCELIKQGCVEPSRVEIGLTCSTIANPHLIPAYPQPYEHLKLFTRQLQNKEGSSTPLDLSTQDFGARQRVLKDQNLPNMHKQLDLYIKEGGDSGKSANNLKQLLDQLY